MFYLATAIVAIVFFYTNDTVRNFYFELYFTTTDKGGVQYVDAGNWSTSIAICVANVIYILGVTAVAAGWSWFVVPGLSEGTNSIRATADSLAFPILSSTILMSLGDFDLYALLANFMLVHVMYVVGGFFADKVVSSSKSWTATNYSSWIFVLIIIPTIVYLSYMRNLDGTPTQVWVALGLQWAYWLIQGLIQRAYYMYKSGSDAFLFTPAISPEKNTRYYENLLQLTTLVFTQAICWTLFSIAWSNASWLNSVDNHHSTLLLNNTGYWWDHLPVNSTNGLDSAVANCRFTGTSSLALPCHLIVDAIAPR